MVDGDGQEDVNPVAGASLPAYVGVGGSDLAGSAIAAAGLAWLTWRVSSGEATLRDPGDVLGLGESEGRTSLSALLAALSVEDAAQVEETLTAPAEEGRDVAVEWRAGLEDGRRRVVELRGRLVRDGEAALVGTAVLRDVTESRVAEQDLRASVERFRKVFQEAPVAIVLTTPDDVLVEVNAAFERLTGYAREELVGRNAKALGFWSSREDQEAVAARLRGDTPSLEPLDLQLRTRNGRVRDVLVSITPGPIDHTGGLVKLMLDVTERRGSQRKLTQAVREVMKDTTWLAQGLVEKLAELEGERVRGPSLAELTERELAVLSFVAEGLSNEDIAARLGIAISTVRNYMSSLYLKLGVESRAGAVVWARERGLGGE